MKKDTKIDITKEVIANIDDKLIGLQMRIEMLYEDRKALIEKRDRYKMEAPIYKTVIWRDEHLPELLFPRVNMQIIDIHTDNSDFADVEYLTYKPTGQSDGRLWEYELQPKQVRPSKKKVDITKEDK